MGNSKKKELTKSSKSKSNKLNGIKKNSEASARFKKITARAQEIRKAHPKMQWKNAVRKASKELF